MSFSSSSQAPSLSQLIKSKAASSSSSSSSSKTTREDWKKQKELEEARKAGTAPAAVDETGKDINPHIPQYISSAPWYYEAQGPTLRHQRVQDESKKVYAGLDQWYKKGVDLSKVATKYRKGACENCGALTHKRKDCLERPRKVGAKFTGEGIAPDEHLQSNIDLDFDGKRDRWNGYDPGEYQGIVEEFQRTEDAKRLLKAEKLKKSINQDTLPDNMVAEEEDESEEDEDKYVDDIDMPGTKIDSKERITVRNLRIREDTAKYLRNLDPNSAYYDPKTRSMRDNPYKDVIKDKDSNIDEEVDFAGENFVRFTGDTTKHAQAQLFAWEAQEKGVDVNLMAEPTKLEILKKEFEKKKDEFKGSLTKSVIDKYGGDGYLSTQSGNRALLFAQTEDYVEYNRMGKVVKGGDKKVVIRSRYEEDVLINNHTEVWGSYWIKGEWGYGCCHSLVYNSYCVGERGRTIVNDDGDAGELIKGDVQGGEGAVKEDEKVDLEKIRQQKELKEKKNKDRNKRKKDKKKKNKNKKKKGSSSSSDSDSDSDSDSESKKERLKAALLEEEKRQRYFESDDRKRAYNSMYDVKAPTEEEMEAYLLKRRREEDPMFL